MEHWNTGWFKRNKMFFVRCGNGFAVCIWMADKQAAVEYLGWN